MRSVYRKVISRQTCYSSRHSPRPPSICLESTSTIICKRTASASSKRDSKDKRIQEESHGFSVKNNQIPQIAQPHTLDIKEALKIMHNVLKRLSELDRSSFSSLGEIERIEDPEIRRQLFLTAKNIVQALAQSVENGVIKPWWGRQGRELSKLMESVLLVYSETPIADVSVYQECNVVLESLNKWNLDVRNAHFEYAIAVANREGRWTDASDLFWRQVDPEAGHSPVNISISNPAGLIAIARTAQNEGSAVVERVYDAVLRMSMVSPSDQAKYVLAAGTALGYVGECEGAMAYLRNSYSASELGQHLVAGVMRTCLLCGRPSDALKVFDESIYGEPVRANEWQWGGQREGLDPLCRDLAMQAMLSSAGMSSTALQLLRQAEEDDVTISCEALRGVVGACEQDGEWEGARYVLSTILDRSDDLNWIVPASDMIICNIHDRTNVRKNSASDRWLPQIGDILASVMRTLNSSSQFGISLFYCRQFHLCMALNDKRAKNLFDDKGWERGTNMCMEHSLLPLLIRIHQVEDVLAAMMVSLCGLRCYDRAVNLFEIVETYPLLAGTDFNDGEGRPSNIQHCYEFAKSEMMNAECGSIGNSWESAYRHIHRLTGAVHYIRYKNEFLSPEDRDTIDSALAVAMRACTEARQAEQSLLLCAWVESSLSNLSHRCSVDKMITNLIENGNSTNSEPSAFYADSVYAQAILACISSGRNMESVKLFESLLESKSEELSEWKLSVTTGLSAMCAAGLTDNALEILNELDESARIPETFYVVSRSLLQEQKWNEISGLYRTSLTAGCLSEELSLVTMSAAVSSDIEGKLRILRTIVDDTVTLSGSDPKNWMKSRYWHLKRYVGFNYARLLLWWNDPETCHLDELELSLEEFEKSKESGIKLSNDIIRIIVSNAKTFHEDAGFEARNDLDRLPRTNIDWINLLLELIQETQGSSVHHDADFVNDVVTALRRWNCNIECVAYVQNVLMRGTRPHQVTLNVAIHAAGDEDGLDHMVHNFQMLLDEKK